MPTEFYYIQYVFNIVKVFTVTFDQFSASFLNKNNLLQRTDKKRRNMLNVN